MALEARRVLVVEDVPHIREIVTVFLRRTGYLVESAEDGHTASMMLIDRGYDLVVTDFMMPRLTGVQLIKWMRDRNDTTPVLLMSGTVPEAALAAARKYGAVEVMEKPFERDDLVERVERLITFQRSGGGDRAS
jgi:DNA-binding response OmpR family regulator